MNTSPFLQYRDMVMGHYSTAKWLRGVVMSLYNGRAYPVGLSQLTNTDTEHFTAFTEMVVHYRRAGEGGTDRHPTAGVRRGGVRCDAHPAEVHRATDFRRMRGLGRTLLRRHPALGWQPQRRLQTDRRTLNMTFYGGDR